MGQKIWQRDKIVSIAPEDEGYVLDKSDLSGGVNGTSKRFTFDQVVPGDYLINNNDQIKSTTGKNLYNERGANTTGKYLDGSGNEITHATAFISYYIPIIGTVEYAYQGFYAASTNFCTYDIDKTLVNCYQTGTATGTFTPTANELFVRFSIRNENEFMLEYGSTQSTYEAYSRYVDKLYLPQDYENLDIAVFGDSITEQADNWTETFDSILNTGTITNMGLSGQKICWRAGTTETTSPTTGGNDNNVLWNSILKYQNDYPSADPDVIIIFEGTNDISQSSPLGTYADAFAQSEATTSQQTMAGAFRKALFRLMTDYADAQIFYCTPIQGLASGRTYTNLKSVADINGAIANRMTVKVINCLDLSGIQEEFEVDGGAGRYLIDGVHPSTAGSVMVGKCIAKEFEKLYYLT